MRFLLGLLEFRFWKVCNNLTLANGNRSAQLLPLCYGADCVISKEFYETHSVVGVTDIVITNWARHGEVKKNCWLRIRFRDETAF